MPSKPLQGDHVLHYDECDTELVNRYGWYAGKRRGCWYAFANVRGDGKTRLVRFHRIALNAPADAEVDHKNGNGLDNRRVNLRLATRIENSRNRRYGKAGRAYPKGVRKLPGGTFQARITTQPGRVLSLGCFVTAEEASRAYDRAAVELFGAFARTNGEGQGLAVSRL